jgi:secretion/DNA translocation related TadE-like protein
VTTWRAAWRTSERGLGTILVLTVVALLLAVLGGVLALGQTLIARHRAASAADLAALAAADRALEGSAAACAAAAAIAAEHAAAITRCRLDGEIVEVTAAVVLPSALRALGPAMARARAGPAAREPRGPPSQGRSMSGLLALRRSSPLGLVLGRVERGNDGRLPHVRDPVAPPLPDAPEVGAELALVGDSGATVGLTEHE